MDTDDCEICPQVPFPTHALCESLWLAMLEQQSSILPHCVSSATAREEGMFASVCIAGLGRVVEERERAERGRKGREWEVS